MVCSGYRLFKVNREGCSKTYQNLFYSCLLIGCGLFFAMYFFEYRSSSDPKLEKIIFCIELPAGTLILFAYLLMIPVQAKLYYLCYESENGKFVNPQQKVPNLYTLIVVITILPFILEMYILIKPFKQSRIVQSVVSNIQAFVCILLWIYYGSKLTGIVKRVAGEQMWSKTVKLFIVELVWSLIWIVSQIIFTATDLELPKTDSNGKVYYNLFYHIWFIIQSTVPAASIMFVVFESPKRVRMKELLLDKMDSSSSDDEF
ncbi:hypothetical protein M0812_16042 [Anaeramoeba flamelloides]|uniref:Uncharacterized protein n=1 Tax=Anaeramoeba flamelloides TaxID=1746091 RepID=A0AAV7ZDA9_9EUKA|nr:hypothetical protein M0812_16042 [Anaeramoeba flamelloides]